MSQLSSMKEMFLKKTKRSEKMVDIKENIYCVTDSRQQFESFTGQKYQNLALDTNLYQPVLYMQLTAGSVVNIKPELLMQAFFFFFGVDYEPLQYQVHRLEMYGDLDGKKGEVHLLTDAVPCRLVPLSEYK